MWFAGESFGAILGEILFVDFIGPEYGSHLKTYLFALLCAVIIGGAGFGIGICLPIAIGRHPNDDRFGRRGEVLDPDRGFDFTDCLDRLKIVGAEELTARNPQTDTEKLNDRGFRPHPGR
jgi:hypothetical protein